VAPASVRFAKALAETPLDAARLSRTLGCGVWTNVEMASYWFFSGKSSSGHNS
jgi:hypothetical protein